jgi:signal transduction histidine kinase
MHAEILCPAKGLVLAAYMLDRQMAKRWFFLAALGLWGGRLLLSVPLINSILGTTLSLGSIASMALLNDWLVVAEQDFSEWRRLLKFFATGCFVSISFGIPAALLESGPGITFSLAWVTWSLGTLLSFAVLTPPLVLLGRLMPLPDANARLRKVLLANVPLVAVVFAVFGQSFFPVTYLVPPVLFYIALVAEVDGVALGLLLTATIAVTLTALGFGPASLMRGSMLFRVNTIQFLLGSLTMTTLPTAAVISERRRLQDRLETALVRAQSAALAKTEFLANMSHELRTPLASVIGFAEALSDYRTLDDQAKHYVDRVKTAGRALLSTVNSILDYSRLERGEVELQPEYFSLQEFLQETLDVFAIQAREKGLELNLSYPEELDAAIVLADPNYMRQVLLNLLGNGLKFTDRGSVTVRASCSGPADRCILRCEVIDTGRGMTPKDMDSLFFRFSQVGRISERNQEGVGLGLAICKAIISKMGGEIGATSKPGEGSTFWFKAPVTVYDPGTDDVGTKGVDEQAVGVASVPHNAVSQ